MNIDEATDKFKNSIKKLATKNNVEYEVMLENWKQKFNEFDMLTEGKGFSEDLELFESNREATLVALTINGSILIVSCPDATFNRKVRYQSIRIRTDDSKNVPEIFTGRILNDVRISQNVIFEKIIETSAIIKIKSSEDCEWEEFDDVADEMSLQFTRKFEEIDANTITKRLNELEDDDD